jgi:hypothetical protein
MGDPTPRRSNPDHLFDDPAYRDAQFSDYRKSVDQAEVLAQASQQAGENATPT